MSAVTVSPKFQIVIPKDAREFLHIQPGQKLEVIMSGGHLALVPVTDIEGARGFLKGMDPSIPAEKERY